MEVFELCLVAVDYAFRFLKKKIHIVLCLKDHLSLVKHLDCGRSLLLRRVQLNHLRSRHARISRREYIKKTGCKTAFHF